MGRVQIAVSTILEYGMEKHKFKVGDRVWCSCSDPCFPNVPIKNRREKDALFKGVIDSFLGDQVILRGHTPGDSMLFSNVRHCKGKAKKWKRYNVEKRGITKSIFDRTPISPKTHDFLSVKKIKSDARLAEVQETIAVGRLLEVLKGMKLKGLILKEYTNTEQARKNRITSNVLLFCYPKGIWTPKRKKMTSLLVKGSCLPKRKSK